MNRVLDLVNALASLFLLARIEPKWYRIIIYTGYKVLYHLKYLDGFVAYLQMTANHSHKYPVVDVNLSQSANLYVTWVSCKHCI